jgi:hypothetical protein
MESVRVTELHEGDLVDLEGDQYLGDFDYNPAARYEYAEVLDIYPYRNDSTNADGVVIETSQGTAFVPTDYRFKRQHKATKHCAHNHGGGLES